MPSRAISAIAVVAGKRFVCSSLDIELTTQQNSDTLSADISFHGQPAAESFWESVGDEEVEGIINGKVMFIGKLDNVNLAYDRQEVRISARDNSRGPIEKKSTESFKNKKSEELVSEIASRHGLSPVIKGSSTKAGKTQQIDWVKLTDKVSDWTLIQHLADRDGKVAYVTKNELHYEDIDDTSYGTVSVNYAPPTPAGHAMGDFLSLSITRNIPAGRPTKVNVKSWHTKKKKAIHKFAQEGGNGAILNFDYTHASLEDDQAQRIADKRLREIKRQEITVECELVGNTDIVPRKRLQVSGCGALSQDYFIDRAGHHADASGGYTTSVTAKNSSQGGGAKGAAAGTAADGTAAASSEPKGARFNDAFNGAIVGR